MQAVRASDPASIADYAAAMDSSLMFRAGHRRLRLFRVLSNTAVVLRATWPHCMGDLRQRLGLPKLTARHWELFPKRWGAVVKGAVIVSTPGGQQIESVVRKSCRQIVRVAARAGRRHCGRLSYPRYLPIEWARVGVFCADHRVRELFSYDLGSDLICTVELNLMSRSQAPDILDSQIERVGPYRIAWNRAWLEREGKGASDAGSGGNSEGAGLQPQVVAS